MTRLPNPTPQPTYHDDVDFVRVYYLLDALSSRHRDYGLSTQCAGNLTAAACELIDWGQHAPEDGMADLLEAATASAAFAEIHHLLGRLLEKTEDLETTLRITRTRDLVVAAQVLP